MTVHSSRFLLVAAAGLSGAAGVALAAIATHRVDSPALATAATMLMIHAVAGIALAAVSGISNRPNLWCVLSGAVLAAAGLFAGDIALHTLAGFHIFPMAAPTGGSLLILSWLAVAICAVLELKGARREP